VAREFNRLEENPPQVDLNGQEIGYHESDYWDPIAASIHRMGGSGNFIWIDNKERRNSSIAATRLSMVVTFSGLPRWNRESSPLWKTLGERQRSARHGHEAGFAEWSFPRFPGPFPTTMSGAARRYGIGLALKLAR
jgi:hypothetical protein